MSRKRNNIESLFHHQLPNTPYAIFLLLVLVLGACRDSGRSTPPNEPNESDVAGKEKTEETTAFAVTVTGSGRPMILIPGVSCGGDVWAATVNHFKDRYECHMLTLAGFAGQPAIGGEPFLERVRDALIEYIRNKKLERPVIVGHSLGGFMAFWLGATAPDKVGPIIAVDGVPYYTALINPKATPESVQQQAEAMRKMYKNLTQEQFALQNQQFLSMMITDTNDLKKIAVSSGKSEPEAVAQAFYEMMTIDLRMKVKAIRTPVLLMGSTAMMTNPEMKKQTQKNYMSQVEAIPRHKVVFATKARHFIQIDEPEFFFREVESFLRTADNETKK